MFCPLYSIVMVSVLLTTESGVLVIDASGVSVFTDREVNVVVVVMYEPVSVGTEADAASEGPMVVVVATVAEVEMYTHGW
ncbi:hypothetical protein OGAPHI_002196 [Ogataea philodendri]|uniref:Secreted protein n=1 Tax=Ogataea philodendri TaxID=1378263 RepID=A0A9P8PBU5_9ASCO|nr:uncharacterized protein OGAPHI_002196 [Ogataea philodendri]KAH3668442.1 hypothetical protein OGAPHI_002196 [Ogataea philodendri]